MQTKQCTKCMKTLPVSGFYKHRYHSNGLTSRCKNCHRKYRETHKEETAKCGRAYRKTNKEKIVENGKKYRRSHKEEITRRNREYRKTHKEKIAKSTRVYCKAHPEKMRARAQCRYARKLDAAVEKFFDIEIFERDGWVCGICGKYVDETLKYPHPRSKSLDHIIPLIDGGGHIRANVQLSHLGCNVKKNIKRNGQLRLIS